MYHLMKLLDTGKKTKKTPNDQEAKIIKATSDFSGQEKA